MNEEVLRTGRAAAVMTELLGHAVKEKGETRVRCVCGERHKNGDNNPSASANAEKGLVHCPVCNYSADIPKLVVDRGCARNIPGARQWLHGKCGIAAAVGTGPSTEFVQRSFPYKDLATEYDWAPFTEKRQPGFRLPIYDERGDICGVKARTYKRNGKAVGWVQSAKNGRKETGLIGGVPELVAAAGAGRSVFLVAGETCYLAVKAAARSEGIDVIAVSHSNGESVGAGRLGGRARAFAGTRTTVIYDMDDTGREGAAARSDELIDVNAVAVNFELPFTPEQKAAGCKDLRDWLEKCGGTVARLLELTAAAKPWVRSKQATGKPDVRAARDAPRSEAPPAKRRRRTKIWTNEEIDKLDLVPPTPIVEGLMHEGHTALFYGDPASGKSWLVWTIAVLIACGMGWLIDPRNLKKRMFEVKVPGGRKVLLVLGINEDSKRRYRDRRRQIEQRYSIAGSPNLRLTWPTWDPFTSEGFKRMCRMLRRADLAGGVLVLDNIWSLSQIDLRDETNVAEVWKCVAAWKRRFKLAGVIVVAHGHKPSRDGKEAKTSDRMYGSRRTNAAADVIVSLTATGTNVEEPPTHNTVRLEVEKMKDGPQGYGRSLFLCGKTGEFLNEHPDSAGQREGPGGLTPLIVYFALRNHANEFPLRGWDSICAAVTKEASRTMPKAPSASTVRRMVNDILLEPPAWFGCVDRGGKENAPVVLFLRKQDGNQWIETDGDDPPPPPLSDDGRAS
jgi:hypothetical protein